MGTVCGDTCSGGAGSIAKSGALGGEFGGLVLGTINVGDLNHMSICCSRVLHFHYME